MMGLLPAGPLGVACVIATAAIGVALICAAWRLLAGPTLADRVVALDLISGLLVVFLLVFRVATDEDAYAFVALGLALIAFLGTVALAGLIEGTRGPETPDD
jgi:multicomponent Na+:H+ antiporter subunit F